MLKYIKTNLIVNRLSILTLFTSPIIMLLLILLLNKTEEGISGIENIFLALTVVFSLQLITSDLKYSNFLLSLPTSRKTFVVSKYILFLLYTIIVFTIFALETSLLYSLFNVNLNYSIVYENLLLILSTVLIISALLIPINIFLSKKENRFIVALNVFIPMMLPVIAIDLFSYLNYLILITILIVSIIINLFSYISTKHLFQKYSL